MVEFSFVRMPSAGDLVQPVKAHPDDWGYDLQASHEAIIYPATWIPLDTGFGIDLPHGYAAEIRPRSGLAAKHGVTVLNAPGTIDNGYRDTLKVILINHSHLVYRVARGDRIAQLVIVKTVPTIAAEAAAFNEADTTRGKGGLGSTGI
jgi:dUTP pyrophosphatase